MSARAGPAGKRCAGERFSALVDDLATITCNTVAPSLPGAEPFQVAVRPTPLQRPAFRLPGVRPWRTR